MVLLTNQLPQRGLLAGYGVGPLDIGSLAPGPSIPPPNPPEDGPFVWGSGGRRMTPEEVAAEREIAASLMSNAVDFSPAGSFAEAFGRGAQGVLGGLRERQASRAAEANAAESDALIASLLAPEATPEIAARAMTNPNVSQGTQALAKMIWDRANPKPGKPHFWETNDGSLAVVGPDGQPRIVYQDPNPKPAYDWITVDNPDGTKQLVPIGPQGPIMGAGGARGQSVPQAPVGKLTPIPEGGPTPPASGGFRSGG